MQTWQEYAQNNLSICNTCISASPIYQKYTELVTKKKKKKIINHSQSISKFRCPPNPLPPKKEEAPNNTPPDHDGSMLYLQGRQNGNFPAKDHNTKHNRINIHLHTTQGSLLRQALTEHDKKSILSHININ